VARRQSRPRLVGGALCGSPAWQLHSSCCSLPQCSRSILPEVDRAPAVLRVRAVPTAAPQVDPVREVPRRAGTRAVTVRPRRLLTAPVRQREDDMRSRITGGREVTMLWNRPGTLSRCTGDFLPSFVARFASTRRNRLPMTSSLEPALEDSILTRTADASRRAPPRAPDSPTIACNLPNAPDYQGVSALSFLIRPN
jgi:hypothetical protein